MEKTPGRMKDHLRTLGVFVWAYICVKEREREQDHFSSLPQFPLIFSPPFAVTAHVDDVLLKGKADTCT